MSPDSAYLSNFVWLKSDRVIQRTVELLRQSVELAKLVFVLGDESDAHVVSCGLSMLEFLEAHDFAFECKFLVLLFDTERQFGPNPQGYSAFHECAVSGQILGSVRQSFDFGTRRVEGQCSHGFEIVATVVFLLHGA